MKRRNFIGTFAVGGAGSVLAQNVPTPAPAPLVRTPMVLMAPRADGIEAVWAVSRLSRGQLEWVAEDGAKGTAAADSFGFVPQSENVLKVRLSGLKSGMTYRVRSHTTAADNQETITSAWKSFRPLNAAAAGTRFVMWNDTHLNDESIRALQAATPAGDFLLWNGDTCSRIIRRPGSTGIVAAVARPGTTRS